jgi:uncharacterized protein with GYD domain
MAMYVSLLQFIEQGIRNVKDTIKRAASATAEAEKMGAKVTESFWTMGAYDVVLLLEAPNDETVSAFSLKISALGNIKRDHARLQQERDGRHSGEDQIAEASRRA